MLSADQRLLAEGLDGDKDPGGESFEQLFSRFAEMKGESGQGMVCSVSRCCLSHTAHAAALPSEERKEYAEKVGVSSTLVLVLYAPSIAAGCHGVLGCYRW